MCSQHLKCNALSALLALHGVLARCCPCYGGEAHSGCRDRIFATITVCDLQIMSDIERACWCGQVGFTCFGWSGRSSLAAVFKCSSGAGHRVQSSLHFRNPCSAEV